MTSRRPMTRSFSGNGRTSSFSEEEGSSSNGRNTYLSNVRPENRYSHYRPTRSTLCSVMAQLTEDIQPSFETTLKSKAVSENCNVKFTCVVSGYPAPELKWYKDDMEMDRYCGLPKYEIGRNGKTHTLHIYNCTLDDAAIYQASASNSKGIVSCSGVLEVGTMNEYKIHQRFFAKLKQKAEKKKKDLEEQTKKQDKTNTQREKPQKTPERPPRKRPILPPKEKPVVKEPEVGEQVGAAAEPNGVSSEVMETETISSTNSSPEKEVPPSGETLAKKKIKISNGVDVGVSNSSSSSSSSENCYDGGISLAQFLAETLQSQSAEEKQNSSRVEKPKEMNVPVVNDNHSKHGSEVKHHSRAHKDHDHHNIQASISSMLHTVKDFFFGKSKKGFHDHIEDREREFDHYSIQPPQPETPPSFRLQQECNPDVYKPLTEDVVPMETDKPNESSGSVYMEQPSVSLETHEHKHEDSVLHTDLTPADKLPPKSTEESTRQSVKEVEDAAEAMEVSVGTGSSSPGEEIPLSGLQVLTETEDKDSQVVSVISKVPVNQQEPDCLVVSPRPDHQAARDASSPREDISVLPLTKTPSEEGEEQLSIDKMGEEAKPEKAESRKQNLEEVSDKSVKESTPSLLLEAPLPKVGDNVVSINKTAEDNIVPEKKNKIKPLKEAKIENSVSVEDPQKNRCTVERLSCKPPAHPSLSPASLRKFMPKAAPDSDSEAVTAVPVITVGDRQSDKADEDLSGGSTPTSSLSCESSPRLKRRDSLSLIRSATPEELASGARRKIFIPKAKDDGEGAVFGVLDTQGKKETPYMSPSQARRAALLQASTGQNTPPMERRSPLLSRRKATLEVPKVVEETPKDEPVTKKEEKPAEKKLDPLKAPQVIRKIRGEPFPDASGHLKLWCQFFNVLSDSTIKWYRDEEEILEVKRSGGDESQVALAIVLASSQDCGVYGCTIKNEYGSDTTDFLLSVDILSEILLRDDLEVGEEIEMTPMLFNKGLADCGNWGEKFFGRIMTETVNIGEGCAHKASKVKVIYGLDPVFDSGSNCIIKVQNPIAYGTKQESNLTERNLEISKQECKVQNMIREYCKIFAAEARVIENFGHSLEVIPQYLMYRPANSVPYATVEADLAGVFLKYCMMDPKGRLITRTTSEVEQKCSTFQHWIHQWTHGNLLVTRLEGVEAKLTNVRAVTKSKGYQGLTEYGSPEVFEQFLTQHQCNYYCGLLGLRPLKSMDSLLQPTKIKGSRSPLLNRKLGSNSPQLQRKGQSPQLSRKANSSPRVTRKVQEPENNKSDTKPKSAETVNALEMP
ncbi:alpha-protein kinase 3-like [Seriola dumerili]|uniref:alpha-protein kinase 3-like n=1 Tax=Seriola dumerili TaxID=41447 RepID=UPI000BBE1C29|nr:alpha-protein kinase 3-like [Seriola dumerili]